MSPRDPPRTRQVLFRLWFVVVLVAGAMGYSVGSAGFDPVRIGALGLGVSVPPGLGLAVGAMAIAAMALLVLFAASARASRQSDGGSAEGED